MVSFRDLFQDGRDEAETQRLRERARSVGHALMSEADLGPLMDRVGDARFVLLGEASHGTSEYYRWRTRITQRLIAEKGFSFVGVEGDWPDCYRVNRYIKDYPKSGSDAGEVCRGFARWSTWMWGNREIVHLAEWMRGWNETRGPEEQVGFYGLDVYSLWHSMEAVLEYLSERDPAAARRALGAYRCFEPYSRDEQAYARATIRKSVSCEEETLAVLSDLRRRAPVYPDGDEAAFDADQNALCVVNAERYYRAMVRADDESWNLRDTHMADTLDRLCAFHRRSRDVVKAVVWAHNTHIGDARATDMADAGMTNIGQIVRERHGREGVVLVGFSGYQGSVIAARGWGEPMEKVAVPEAMEGSWDEVLSDPSGGARLLVLDRVADEEGWLRPRGQRAIGVVYHPRFERPGNYVRTVLPERYDAVVALRGTRALTPLHPSRLEPQDVPETYPSGV
jgi:erythromycin esterase